MTLGVLFGITIDGLGGAQPPQPRLKLDALAMTGPYVFGLIQISWNIHQQSLGVWIVGFIATHRQQRPSRHTLVFQQQARLSIDSVGQFKTIHGHDLLSSVPASHVGVIVG